MRRIKINPNERKSVMQEPTKRGCRVASETVGASRGGALLNLSKSNSSEIKAPKRRSTWTRASKPAIEQNTFFCSHCT